MRVSLFAFLTAALLVSGCFGGDDEGTPPTTTTPPDDGTPTTPTNATGGNGTGPTPTTPTTGNGTGDGGTAPPPQEVHSESVNFARPPGEATSTPFEVPEGYSTIVLNVTWTPDAAVSVSASATVTITGPEGTELPCAAPASGPSDAPVVCTVTAENPEAGAWTATYAGEGTWQADVVVTVS